MEIHVFQCVFFVQALHMPGSKNSPGRIQPKIKKLRTSRLGRSARRTRSRPGAERIWQGEGRLSRPAKTALERSYLTENSNSGNRVQRPRGKKLLTESPPKRMIIHIFIIYLCFCRSSGCCLFRAHSVATTPQEVVKRRHFDPLTDGNFPIIGLD